MQDDLKGFDANDHEPLGDFTPLPKGDYLAIGQESEWKDTKKGDGQHLDFKWQVLEGEHKGRILFSLLNLRNPNATAVKMANGELSGICRAVGVMRPSSSSELLNKPLVLSVDIEERNDKPGVFKNVITAYEATTGGAVGVAQEPAAPATNGAKPPWAK